jgi:hypothetical protein
VAIKNYIDQGQEFALCMFALALPTLSLLRQKRQANLAAWIGLLVVVQNIVNSLFNSHLFDFVEGWVYLLGVGIAGGITLGAGRTVLRRSPGFLTVSGPARDAGGGAT